jgi:hypothetical protein
MREQRGERKKVRRGVPACSEERKLPPDKPGAFGGVTQ